MPPTRPATRPASSLTAAAALLTVYLVWGSTYLGIAVMVQTLPPLPAAAVRFLVAGVLLLGWCALRGSFRTQLPTWREWRAAAVVGGLLLLGGNGLVVLAEQRVPSGIAALLVAMVPLWLAVLDALLARRWPSPLVIGGVLAGLAGVAFLVWPGTAAGSIDWLGAAMLVGAALSWAGGTLVARDAALPRDRLVATGMEMLAGGVLLAVVGAATGQLIGVDPSRFSFASLAALAYLIVFGSLVAFTAYIWLVNHVPTSTVGTYAYVNPVVAVALGALFLAEPITLRTVIASVIIIGAVAAMVTAGARGRPSDARAAPAEPGSPLSRWERIRSRST